jgi:hypothetical protein
VLCEDNVEGCGLILELLRHYIASMDSSRHIQRCGAMHVLHTVYGKMKLENMSEGDNAISVILQVVMLGRDGQISYTVGGAEN